MFDINKSQMQLNESYLEFDFIYKSTNNKNNNNISERQTHE